MEIIGQIILHVFEAGPTALKAGIAFIGAEEILEWIVNHPMMAIGVFGGAIFVIANSGDKKRA